MATISSDRGLTVPAVGADNNVWGGELNTTIAALDTMFGGTISLYSSASFNQALGSTGVAQAQVSRVVVYGLQIPPTNVLVANLTLNFASSNYALGSYQIWNNTAGPGGIVCATSVSSGLTCTVNAGTMRSINADGVNVQFADSQPIDVGVPSYINKFRNPGMDVFQRGPAAVTLIPAGAYVFDGWMMGAATGTINVTQVYNVFLSGMAMRLSPSGSTVPTGVYLQQRIESVVAAQMLGIVPSTTQPITVRFDIYNNSGSVFTPQLSASYPNATDNYSATTVDLAPVNLQPCPNGALTTVAYTFTPSVNIARGYQITLMLGSVLTILGGTIDISHADVRITPTVAAGLNFAPPTPEVRPIHAELRYCQRYFFVPFAGWWYVTFTAAATGYSMGSTAQFPTPMRIKPTATALTFVHTNSGVPSQPGTGQSQYGWTFNATNSAATVAGVTAYITGGQFSAEL